MSYVTHLKGIQSGQQYPAGELMNLDPVDGRPVEMIFDLERLQAEQPDLGWYRPKRKDMWRFGGLLALDINDPEDSQYIVTQSEGYTPELNFNDYPLARSGGFNLRVKDEGMAHPGYGANPTLSFKDRGMAMVASQARRFGLQRLVVPTQGNAGDSLAEYARAAGLQAAVVMPENTPMPIQGKVAAYAARYPGFKIDFVQGTIREAGELMKQRYLPEGWFNVATFQEPGWRIDGKKTLGLEMAEPKEAGGKWSLPDVIIYPTGGGTGILGMWKAFDELECLGLIGPERPRFCCIQSDASTPLVKAMASGADDTVAEAAGDTLAYGINVPGGVGQFRVLEIIRASGGCAVAVEEKDIHRTLSAIWQDKGWWFCPEGSACIAALQPLLDMGMIRPGDDVVAVNTGSLEKYLPDLRHLL